ncbi:hypothetical protein [Planctomycetes bacterium K23_9]|uniref:Uncharacterized protein n=1 Tax=Stieleria marina TaxID=1930275 RepID=A0A517NMU8_9BACT|nr:hypothetical protein K239x_03930 [Planctomycetes bacterium K23_9]
MQRFTSQLIIAGLLAATAQACNIPVFRYALERWKPDACEILVFFPDQLTKQQESALERQGKASPRITITRDTKTSKIGGDKGPLIAQAVVRCKVNGGKVLEVWKGNPSHLPELQLADSPARQEIQRRLLKGDSIVWLVLESEDEKKNRAIKQQLDDRFQLLADKLQLPEGIGLPGSELFSETPLLLQFSTLTIAANNPEEVFLSTLLTKIEGSAYRNGEPLVVPIFGRGRALEVIPANELSDQLIDDLTVFLSGACSCQVKERNPGFDLLITADWDTELFGADGEIPADTPLHQQQNQPPATLTIPPGRK